MNNVFEAIRVIEEFIKRIQLRGKYPLETELDLIKIAFEVGLIKTILRDAGYSKTHKRTETTTRNV